MELAARPSADLGYMQQAWLETLASLKSRERGSSSFQWTLVYVPKLLF